MPVIFRKNGYRLWFYMADLVEPAHLHVARGGCEAKFWITDIELCRNRGFRRHELNEIERIISENQTYMLEAWNREMEKRDS